MGFLIKHWPTLTFFTLHSNYLWQQLFHQISTRCYSLNTIVSSHTPLMQHCWYTLFMPLLANICLKSAAINFRPAQPCEFLDYGKLGYLAWLPDLLFVTYSHQCNMLWYSFTLNFICMWSLVCILYAHVYIPWNHDIVYFWSAFHKSLWNKLVHDVSSLTLPCSRLQTIRKWTKWHHRTLLLFLAPTSSGLPMKLPMSLHLVK